MSAHILLDEIERIENIRLAIGATEEIAKKYDRACASFMYLRYDKLKEVLSADPVAAQQPEPAAWECSSCAGAGKVDLGDNPDEYGDPRQECPGCDGKGAAPFGVIDPDYARAFTIARCLAWAEGYALTLHGSFTRDLDLLAVPWREQVCEPEHLVRRVCESAGLKQQVSDPSTKAHGRKVWTLRFAEAFGDPRFIDFGVMPPQQGTVGASEELYVREPDGTYTLCDRLRHRDVDPSVDGRVALPA